MDSQKVTRRQAQIVRGRVVEMRSYLFRLRKRMTERGFPPDDRLFQLVRDAELAIGELFIALDILRREGPVNLPERKPVRWIDQKSARERH